MAESAGFVGKGTVLSREDPIGGGVYVAIAEVVDIDEYSLERNFADATHLTSDDGYEEEKPGFKKVAPFSFTANFIPDDGTQDFTTGVAKDWEDGVKRNYRIEFSHSSGKKYQFAARVGKLTFGGVTRDGMVAYKVELRPQGKVIEV